MPFEKIPSFSRNESREKFESELLEAYLKEKADEFRKMGIPVGDDFRIYPYRYEGVYPLTTIEGDEQWVREKEKEFQQERKNRAELLEKYVPALFNKHFEGILVAVRSSKYDDMAHHIDNIVVDSEKGIVVCAFDEVGAIQGPTYEQKTNKVLQRNLGLLPQEGGAKVKYGFLLERDKRGNLVARLKRINHVPIFYIALSEEDLRRGISEFNPSKEKTTPHEIKMLQYFLTSIEAQIDGLRSKERELEEKEGKRLHPDVKTSILGFREIISNKLKSIEK